MTVLWSVLGIAAVTAVSVIFIKQYRPETALLLSVSGGILILLFCISDIADIFAKLREMLSEFSVDGAIFNVIIKSLGVCLVTDFAGNTCRDFGHLSLASGVEFAGKIVVLVLSLPIISEIVTVAVELIK